MGSEARQSHQEVTQARIYRTTRVLGWVFYPNCKTRILEAGSVVIYLGEFLGRNPIDDVGRRVPHTHFQYEGEIIFRYESLKEMIEPRNYIEIL